MSNFAAQDLGTHFPDDMTLFKTKARKEAQQEARGTSATTMLDNISIHLLEGKERDARGDPWGAVASYVKAAAFSVELMESAEFVQEMRVSTFSESSLLGGLADFLEGEGPRLTERMCALEEQLKMAPSPKS